MSSVAPQRWDPVLALVELNHCARVQGLHERILNVVRHVDFSAPAPGINYDSGSQTKMMEMVDASSCTFFNRSNRLGVVLESPHVVTPYPLGLCSTRTLVSVLRAAIELGRLEPGRDPVIGLDSAGNSVGLVESTLFAQMLDLKLVLSTLQMTTDDLQRVVLKAEARFTLQPEIPSTRFPVNLAFNFQRVVLEGATLNHALWSRLGSDRRLVEGLAAIRSPGDKEACTRAIRILLDAGFPMGSALHRACEQVRPEIVRLLLAYGADPSERDQSNVFTPKELIGADYQSRGARGQAAKTIEVMLDASLAHQEAMAVVASMARSPTEAPSLSWEPR